MANRPIGVAEVALPAGAATSAKQDTIKTSIDAITTKLAADPSTATLQTAANTILGATTEAPASVSVDEDTTARSLIALAKGLKNLQIDIKTLLETTGITLLPLDSSLDSIDVDKMSKGAVTVAHSVIADTATSSEIDCRGYNSLLVYVGPFTAAENWTFKVQGCMTSGGTFSDWYEQANTGVMALMSYQTNASRGWVWHGIPDYIKIVATRDGAASAVTVTVQPFNG
jgi:hypothetical protein